MPRDVAVKTVDGKQLSVSCDEKATVAAIKKELVEKHGFLDDGLKLVYKGKVPKDEDTLESVEYDDKKPFVLVGKRKNSIVGSTMAKRRKMEEERQKEEPKKEDEKLPVMQDDQTPPPREEARRTEPPGAPIAERSALERMLQDSGWGIVLDGMEDLSETDLLRLEEESSEPDSEEEGEMSDLQQFAEGLASIRQRLAADPSSLPTILQELQASHPTLYENIEADPETFLAFINGDDANIPLLEDTAAPGEVSLTPADEEAINRLASLAQVPIETARHAYIAMGKNEEAAANMLFD
eukprot:TRINITY_DN11653_c0_g1_i1.p1 TRINITY_DN11653_c0_g1~~TRINITY_DN11653_c0_g1_i1.p1  ORF type:complete len:316 (+),score=103.88 TRINITY_DN11653_c0_g1_i1:61-948(+)